KGCDRRMYTANELMPEPSELGSVGAGGRAQGLRTLRPAGMAKPRPQQELRSATRAGLRHGRKCFPQDHLFCHDRSRWSPEFLMRILRYFRHSVSYGENLKVPMAFQPPKR